MFALLGAPEVRHLSTWEMAGEAVRMAQRQAWSRRASGIVDRLIEIAARIAADEDDEDDHDPALEAAGLALGTMMAAGPWRIADTASIRVGSAVARLRRELSPASFQWLRYAYLLDLVDDQDGARQRGVDVGLPAIPEQLGSTPAVGGPQLDAEQVAHLAEEVGEVCLLAREDADLHVALAPPRVAGIDCQVPDGTHDRQHAPPSSCSAPM